MNRFSYRLRAAVRLVAFAPMLLAGCGQMGPLQQPQAENSQAAAVPAPGPVTATPVSGETG